MRLTKCRAYPNPTAIRSSSSERDRHSAVTEDLTSNHQNEVFLRLAGKDDRVDTYQASTMFCLYIGDPTLVGEELALLLVSPQVLVMVSQQLVCSSSRSQEGGSASEYAL